ncbi:helix-turn-helix transcriptional regulator [Mycobacteroides abscessus]|uniref:helix-turn-helix transcriptional regulator n=1 Tax=Mycobacteroides abscessus TaxID=36809 RepID=UPI002106697E|nr:helix-turn-helix transcriptional regulator [Mycobacteroides abscessus]
MAKPLPPDEVEARKRIGQAIAARRTDKKLYQEQLANEIGVHKVTISQIEGGRQGMSPHTARSIERVLKFKSGAFETLRANPEVDPTTLYDDPPPPNALSVKMARGVLDGARALAPQLPGNPELQTTVGKMLASTEANLTLLAEQDFSHDILRLLMDINALRREIDPSAATAPTDMG